MAFPSRRINFADIHMAIAHQQFPVESLDANALAGQRPTHEPSLPLLGEHPLRVQSPHIPARWVFPFFYVLLAAVQAPPIAFGRTLYSHSLIRPPLVVDQSEHGQ